MRSHRLFPAALLLLTSLLWSLGGVLIKAVDWNPMAIAGTRSAIALPVMIACVGWPGWRFSRLQIGGALAYAGTVILFVIATRLTTAANAIFLQYTAPIYVAMAAHWWLGERTRRIDWLVIAVALCGIGVFFLDELTLAGMWGNVAGVASGVAFASLVLCLRKDREGSPVAAVMLGNFVTALLGLPFIVSTPLPAATSWIALALLGTVQLGFSYVLYTIAIKRVMAVEATLIPLLEPILNPLWVMLLVGEQPGRWALVGAAMVIGAVLVRAAVMLRRPAFSAVDEWCLEVPAGGTHDTGDSPLEEVVRKELREEIGGTAKSLTHVGFFYSANALSDEKCHVYLAEGVELVKKQETEASETIAIQLVSAEQAISMARSGAIKTAPCALGILMCEPLLRERAHRRTPDDLLET